MSCLRILGNDLYINLIVTVIVAIVAFPAGLLIEHSFDLIKGKDHKKNRLKMKYQVALQSVVEAERRLPGPKKGMERFELALDLYQDQMGKQGLEDSSLIQMMFEQSTLSH